MSLDKLRQYLEVEEKQEKAYSIHALSARTFFDDMEEEVDFRESMDNSGYLAFMETDTSHVFYRLATCHTDRQAALCAMLKWMANTFKNKPIFVYAAVEDSVLNELLKLAEFKRVPGPPETRSGRFGMEGGYHTFGNVDVFIWKVNDNEDGWCPASLALRAVQQVAHAEADCGDDQYLHHDCGYVD